MLHRLSHWSLANRLLVLSAAMVFLGWAFWQARQMPVDVFPDLAAPAVTVVVEAHDMAPEEVESLVTVPLESALNSAPGVRRVRSESGVGISVITVEFQWDVEERFARQVVSERLQAAAADLPPGLDPPMMGPPASVMGEILLIALSSRDHSPIELRTAADWQVYPRITSVPGISQVISLGGGVKEYRVELSPEALAIYRVGINEVLLALEETNENVTAGIYEEGGREYLIYGLGRAHRVSDLAETLVTTRDGIPLRIGDLGEVTVGEAFKRGEGSLNGEDAVIIAIQKQPDANTLELTRSLDEVFDDLDRTLPSGMVLERNAFRQADFIEVAVDNVLRSLGVGSLLVVLIILLFLGSLRATIITATVIPLSLLVGIMVLHFMGGTINTMTLGGLAIAVGVLVDDAIVVVENVIRRLQLSEHLPDEERPSTVTVIFDATTEVISPLLYANLVVFLVFLPLLFLTGVEGRLLAPLGVAFIVSVLASLVVALTVTPVLCSFLVGDYRPLLQRSDSRMVRWMKARYEPLLSATLGHWKGLTACSLLAVAIAGWGMVQAGQSFLPEFNEGSLTVHATALPGTSLETSDQLGTWVEEVLLKHPEVVTTARRTGRAERDEHAMGVNSSEIEVVLQPGDRSRQEFLAALRHDLGEIPGVNVAIDQPMSHRIDHMLSGARADVALDIFGPDLYELRRLAERVERVISEVPDVVDVTVEEQTDIPFLIVDLDRAALTDHGLRVSQVNRAIETAYAGTDIGQVLEGQRTVNILATYPRAARESVDTIRGTLITNDDGVQIPLHALADIRRDRRPNTISRVHTRRKITVSFNISSPDLVGMVQEVDARIADEVDFPDGYDLFFGGQFERARQASQTIIWLSLIAIFGIFLLFYRTLHSLRDALLVMLNLPLSLIGGVAAIFLLDGVLSVASLIGFITLFGIATRNGLLLVTHIRHLHHQEGVVDPTEAVRRGAMERLSPIVMTALASGLGLLPLALQAGQPGGEIQGPMAMVILFGLISSTILNMVVIPALYLRFGDLRRQVSELSGHDGDPPPRPRTNRG